MDHAPAGTAAASGSFAFVCKAALARNAKSEPVYFPTLYVVPSATKAFGPSDVQLAGYGSALAMEALRRIDPEIAAMSIIPIGGPVCGTYQETGGLEPALRKNGWRVFIDWGMG